LSTERSCAPATFGDVPQEGLATVMNTPYEFTEALKALYRAAGSPEYRRLVEQAAGRRPPVRLSVQSISDWLRGKSVPASWLVVRFLIVHLSELAAQRGTPVPVLDWARLHEQARRARSRDGTAVSRGTVPGPSRFGPLPRPAWRWQLRSRETDVLRLALSAPG